MASQGAKTNVQTNPCDRREPANASSLYLAIDPRPQQPASKLKNQRKEHPKQKLGAVVKSCNQFERRLHANGGIAQSKQDSTCTATAIVNHPICRRSVAATRDGDGPCRILHDKFLHRTDALGATGTGLASLPSIPIVAKSCGAVLSHRLAPAPHEQHYRLRALSTLKHDLRLSSPGGQLSVPDAVLAPLHCVDQKLRS